MTVELFRKLLAEELPKVRNCGACRGSVCQVRDYRRVI